MYYMYYIYYKYYILYIRYIDYLLTECKVCTGKYLSEVFVQTVRRKSEVCVEENRGQILLPYRPNKRG